MATSRPLPPGRRGTGARPPAAMHSLPEPRLLRAPAAAASPARNASEPIERRPEQPPPASQDAAPVAHAPARSWEQRASWTASVVKPSSQSVQPARAEAAAPSPAPAAPPKASGFQAARAMFGAKTAVPAPATPPTKPSRFGAPPPSITTGSGARAPAAWRSTPASPASVPEPPAEQAPSSSVKALISRLNSPAAASKSDKPSTEQHARPSPRFPRVAASASPRPQQRTALATPPPTPSVTHVPAVEPVVHAVKASEETKLVAPAASYALARAPAPAAPVAAPQVRPAVATPPPAAAAPAPSTVTATVRTVASPVVVSPPPAVASSSAQTPVAVDSSISTPEFHPFNLLLPVTAVPVIPRKMDCVYDDAAAEMQKNVMKVVKKLFRKNKPCVDEFKVNAKLYGNGFMDAEEYLESLIKEFRALRALQLVPCLVSIQPDAVKRENLLYSARGYRLRNMDALQGQCEQPVPVESRPRLSSSESIASTVSTVSTVSQAPVDPMASANVKHHEPEKNESVVPPEQTVAAVNAKPNPSPSAPGDRRASELEPKADSRNNASSSTEVALLLASEPVDGRVALLTPDKSIPEEEPAHQTQSSPEVGVVDSSINTKSTGSAPDEVVGHDPAAEVGSGATESVEAKAESPPSEADTDSDSSVADPVTSVSAPPVLDGSAQDAIHQEQPLLQQAEPEAGPSTEADASTPEKPEPAIEQQNDVEMPAKALPNSDQVSRTTRLDSLTSSDDGEEASANALQHNMFGEVVKPKAREAKQPVGPVQPSASVASPPVKHDEAESLFGGSFEPVVVVQSRTSASAIDVDTTDAFTLFGPPSPARLPSNSTREQPASSSKPRKSVTWGETQAKEIPARKVSPPPAPMIFGFATAGAYADSDSDSDSDFD